MPQGQGLGIAPVDLRQAGQGISDLQLRARRGDVSALLQLIEQHTGKLADRYAEPQFFDPQQFTLTGAVGSVSAVFDLTATPHNSLLICVTAGTLNLFAGDASGFNQATPPGLCQIPAVTTQQLFFPLQTRRYTLINPSTTVSTTCIITAMAL